jgi:hypothetical protein
MKHVVGTDGAAQEPSDLAAEVAADAVPLAARLRQFLELGAAQLDAAVRESDARVDVLAATIGMLASDACDLKKLTRQWGADAEGALSDPQERAQVQRLAEAIDQQAQAAITALQFYDKLIQRLTHVRDGLAIPADATASVAAYAAPSWSKLLEQVRARYSTVEERVLFDFMMSGLSAEQMLKALSAMRSSVAAGDYEAF